MTANQEIELKFELDGDDLARRKLRAELERRFGPGKAVKLTSTYFDTADLALREAAMSLRIRRSGNRRLQTVKGPPAAGAGPFARAEWEREIKGDSPDLNMVGDTPLGPLLERSDTRQTLGPAFQSIIERTTWNVDQDGGAYEVALDRGKVKAEGRSARVCELEVELKSGQAGGLLSLARSLDAIAPLRLGGRTKADRGYELLEMTETAAAGVEAPDLSPEMTVAEGFQAIARACMRHFLLNEPLLIRDRSEPALHQTRVALRRLRSAMSLFRTALGDPEFEPLKRRLAALSRQLGDARNLDVFLSAMQAEAGAGRDREALAEAIRRRREAAYDTVVEAMTAPEARRLMFDLAVWVEAGAWASADGPAQSPLPGFARDALDKRWRKLVKRGRRLAKLSEEDRHHVRIEAKKLRYAVEFFAGLFQGRHKAKRHASAFLNDLKALQGLLGDLNDVAQARTLTLELAEAFAERKSPLQQRRRLIYAAGEEAGRRLAGAPRLIKEAAVAHTRLAEAKPFWR
jgi:triphosphatase